MGKLVSKVLGGGGGGGGGGSSGGGISAQAQANAVKPITDIDLEKARQNFPRRINAGGLTAGVSNGTASVGGSPARKFAINQQRLIALSAANQLRGLKRQVRPGFGRLSDTIRSSFRDSRSRVIGDLQETLSRRRLSGSSFANDAVARADAEITKQENEQLARSFLQELDLSTQLAERESQFRIASVQTQLNEMNLKADLALKISDLVQSNEKALLQTQAELGINQANIQSGLLRESANIHQSGKQFESNQTADVVGGLIGLGASFFF